MKLQMVVMCLLMSFTSYAMNEDNGAHLGKALAYARQKKDNEIVIFQYAMSQKSDGEDILDPDAKYLYKLMSSDQKMKEDVEAYCLEDENIVLSLQNESTIGKTIIHLMPQSNIPRNAADSDLFSNSKVIAELRKEKTPFIIATTRNGMSHLVEYLKRQYPKDTIVSFPVNDTNVFTNPWVIAGGIVAMIVLWYFSFKMGTYYEASKYVKK